MATSNGNKFTINGRECAYLLNTDAPTISTWAKDANDPIPIAERKMGRQGNQYDPQVVVQWFIRRKVREAVGGRRNINSEDSDKVLDFHAEKVRLTSAQADKIELENLVKQGKLAEMSVLTETLSNFANIVRAGLDSIPAELRRKCPYLDQAAIDEVETVIADIRNSLDGENVTIPGQDTVA